MGEIVDAAFLRDLAVEKLKNATDAGRNVFSPRDWSTWDGLYPVIFAAVPNEDSQSLGRNVPQFTTTATLQLTARVQMPAVNRDAGAANVLAALEKFKRDLRTTIINDYDITRRIQQFAFIRSRMAPNAEGEEHVGELVMEIGLEYYEGPENFAPIERVPLDRVTVTIVEPPNVTRPAIDMTNLSE